MLWTVVRFPSGHWSTGGKPDDPDYYLCEVWQIEAGNREAAKKKAQARRGAERRRISKLAIEQHIKGGGK